MVFGSGAALARPLAAKATSRIFREIAVMEALSIKVGKGLMYGCNIKSSFEILSGSKSFFGTLSNAGFYFGENATPQKVTMFSMSNMKVGTRLALGFAVILAMTDAGPGGQAGAGSRVFKLDRAHGKAEPVLRAVAPARPARAAIAAPKRAIRGGDEGEAF